MWGVRVGIGPHLLLTWVVLGFAGVYFYSFYLIILLGLREFGDKRLVFRFAQFRSSRGRSQNLRRMQEEAPKRGGVAVGIRRQDLRSLSILYR